MEFICQDCNKVCKTLAALKGHVRLSHTAEGRAVSERARGRANAEDRTPRWNKGLTAQTDKRIQMVAAHVSILFKGQKGTPVTELTKQKLSLHAKQNNYGGYKKGSGRGKHGWCRGYWCDSTWELAWVLYNTDHKVSFTRNHKRFQYETPDGVKHHYTPDFLLEGVQYIEVKGYVQDLEALKRKTSALDLPVLILDKVLIQPFLSYAIRIYGKDLTRMYEDV